MYYFLHCTDKVFSSFLNSEIKAEITGKLTIFFYTKQSVVFLMRYLKSSSRMPIFHVIALIILTVIEKIMRIFKAGEIVTESASG